MKNIKIIKMSKQIVSQLEHMCFKLGLKDGYTLAISNFKRQFVPQKWLGTSKGAITKDLKMSSWYKVIVFCSRLLNNSVLKVLQYSAIKPSPKHNNRPLLIQEFLRVLEILLFCPNSIDILLPLAFKCQ